LVLSCAVTKAGRPQKNVVLGRLKVVWEAKKVKKTINKALCISFLTVLFEKNNLITK